MIVDAWNCLMLLVPERDFSTSLMLFSMRLHTLFVVVLSFAPVLVSVGR